MYDSRPRSNDCVRNMFHMSLNRLEDSGWYWGQLTRHDAVMLLKSAEVGTFLLRDSTDARYLFSLSVRLESNIMNIRVLFSNGKFMFECCETEPWETPKFDCVLKLISYYVTVSKRDDNRAVCARSDLGDDLLKLEKPLYRKVPTLQHLCRRVINMTLSADEQFNLHLAPRLETFMRKYPFTIWSGDLGSQNFILLCHESKSNFQAQKLLLGFFAEAGKPPAVTACRELSRLPIIKRSRINYLCWVNSRELNPNRCQIYSSYMLLRSLL